MGIHVVVSHCEAGIMESLVVLVVVGEWYVVGVLPARVTSVIHLAVSICLVKIVVAVVTLSELCAFLVEPYCSELCCSD